jgi:stress response protein YsnF
VGAVTDAAFTDRTIEVTETEEEAKVGKTARVNEEIVVNRAGAERVESVCGTARREDVEVSQDGRQRKPVQRLRFR